MIHPLPPRRKPDFSLSMINIVFLLLLFFLVAGNIVQKAETTVAPPLTDEIPPGNLPRPLLLLAPGEPMLLDGVPVSLDEVAGQAGAKTQRPGTFLNILAERDMPARPLLDVVERLAAAGVPTRIVTLDSGGAP